MPESASLTASARSDHDRMVAADLFTVPQVAPMLGVHRDTLYRLIRTGQFPPAVKVGAHWRVSGPKLQRFLHGDGS